MHNSDMNNFSDHLAIIGAGISGLALGCTMAKEGHSSIIFEKNKELGSHGAGISISPNAIRVFEGLEMKNHLINSSELTYVLSSQANEVLYYC